MKKRILTGFFMAAALLSGHQVWAADAALTTMPKLLSPGAKSAPRGAPDAWIVLEIEVSTKGRVTGADVLASYPHGLLDDYGLKAAKKSFFRPALRDGVPVVAKTDMAITTLSGSNVRLSLRPENMAPMTDMLNALRRGEPNDEILQPVRARYERNELNMAEAATYLYLQTPTHRLQRNHGAAVKTGRVAARLSGLLGEKVRNALYIEMVINYLANGQVDEAVDFYDTSKKQMGDAFPRPLTDLIERARLSRGEAVSTGVEQMAALPESLE